MIKRIQKLKSKTAVDVKLRQTEGEPAEADPVYFL